MKTLSLVAAAGALATISAPAMAADFAPDFAGASSVPALVTVSADYAGPPRHARAHGRRDRWDDDRWDDRDDRWDDRDDRWERRDRRRIYDDRGRYHQPRRISRRDRIWRGRDGRVYCQRDNGTTGLVIGAGVGALLGRTIDTRGDRTVGTLLGGALGAVLGREIDRGDLRCR